MRFISVPEDRYSMAETAALGRARPAVVVKSSPDRLQDLERDPGRLRTAQLDLAIGEMALAISPDGCEGRDPRW